MARKRTSPVAEAAPAKLNLYLHVLGKRPDGYHLLDSLVAFAAVHDTVSVEPAADLSLTINGPFGAMLAADGENLVLRAATSLAAFAGVESSARIRLTKRLPVASGIGGGSADAAATLRALVKLWKLDLAASDIGALALDLGADVPVCLHGQAAYMGGIGEQLVPVDRLPAAGLVLVNPGVAVSTAKVFSHPACGRSPGGRFDNGVPEEAAALAGLLKTRTNDLAAPAADITPEIGEAVDALAGSDGCLLARMSGSGATCFGIYADGKRSAVAARKIARAHPSWWVQDTSLVSDVREISPAAR